VSGLPWKRSERVTRTGLTKTHLSGDYSFSGPAATTGILFDEQGNFIFSYPKEMIYEAEEFLLSLKLYQSLNPEGFTID
jgi:hypothetical protein